MNYLKQENSETYFIAATEATAILLFKMRICCVIWLALTLSCDGNQGNHDRVLSYVLQETGHNSLIFFGNLEPKMMEEIADLVYNHQIQVIPWQQEASYQITTQGSVIFLATDPRTVSDILLNQGATTFLNNVGIVLQRNQSMVDQTLKLYNSQATETRNRLAINTQLFFFSQDSAKEIKVSTVIGQAFLEPTLKVKMNNNSQLSH